ncbi:hypothetical protein ABPG72_021134 [Tetrahymena utriculariae]
MMTRYTKYSIICTNLFIQNSSKLIQTAIELNNKVQKAYNNIYNITMIQQSLSFSYRKHKIINQSLKQCFKNFNFIFQYDKQPIIFNFVQLKSYWQISSYCYWVRSRQVYSTYTFRYCFGVDQINKILINFLNQIYLVKFKFYLIQSQFDYLLYLKSENKIPGSGARGLSRGLKYCRHLIS